MSVQRRRAARFAGVTLPGPPLVQALTIGTPLSAPPALLVALALAELRSDRRWRHALAIVFAVGVLGEPDSWRALAHPRDQPATTFLVALDLAMPLAMLIPR